MTSDSTRLMNARFVNGGYCLQLEYLSGVSSWRWRRFQAVYLVFEHPVHGRCLIDTGYGPAIFDATRQFPWRILRWFTPIPRGQRFVAPDYLIQCAIDPLQVNFVFLSHFHADHIGGARLFPQCRFVYRQSAYDQLSRLSKWRQLDHGYIPTLLPDDLEARGCPVAEESFSLSDFRESRLSTLDYWGDGSLLLIDLPGHALGHTGYLLRLQGESILYVVDAFWDYRAFRSKSRLPFLSRHILQSYREYQETNERLGELERTSGMRPMACHCLLTQEYIERHAD